MNKSSWLEINMLAVAVAIATSVMFTPYLAARVAAQDAWISVFFAGALSLIPVWAASTLMALFPNQSIIQALPRLMGKSLGKLLGLIYALFFIFSAALAVWRLEVFAARFLLLETPVLAIRALFLVCVVYAAFSGSVPLVRTSAYVVPAGMVAIILVATLPLQRMNSSLLLPIFEQGIGPVLKGGVMLTGWICQIPLVIMMYCRYTEATTRKKGFKFVPAIILSTIAMELGAIGTMAAFGPRQVESLYYPAFELARIISIGAYIEHMEVAFVAVWVAGIFVAASFYLQAFGESISDIFNFQGKMAKCAIFSVATLILLFWPLLFKNLSFLLLIAIIKNYGAVLAGIMGGVLPLLFLIRAAMLPGLKEEAQAAQVPGAGEVGKAPDCAQGEGQR